MARIGKQSSVEPAVAVRDMIARQTSITKERNEYIMRENLELLTSQLMVKDSQDNLALVGLCKGGYDL